MLWYKSWLETRWRFLIGLVLLMFSVAGTVLAYPQVVKLLPLAPTIDVGGEIGRRIREAAELARNYRGYVWSQWFRQNLPQMWTLFAVLLGTGGLLSQASGRRRAVHAVAAGLAQPPARRPGRDGAGGAAGARLRPLAPAAAALAGRRADLRRRRRARPRRVPVRRRRPCSSAWRSCCPRCSATCGVRLLIVLLRGGRAGALRAVLPDLSRYSLFRVMSGEVYFRGGGLPWLGLLASAAVSAAMLYAAIRNIARQDF